MGPERGLVLSKAVALTFRFSVVKTYFEAMNQSCCPIIIKLFFFHKCVRAYSVILCFIHYYKYNLNFT